MSGRDESGEERDVIGMTEAQRLPNNCQQARDDAADRINVATAEILKALAGNDPQARLYKALFLLSEAGRNLESIGAKTLIREL